MSDSHGNRVDLLIGLRGMDPELMSRTRQVRLADSVLEIVGREHFIAMKALAGGPVYLADARALIDLDRESLDLELLRRLARRFGREAARTVEDLIGGVDRGPPAVMPGNCDCLDRWHAPAARIINVRDSCAGSAQQCPRIASQHLHRNQSPGLALGLDADLPPQAAQVALARHVTRISAHEFAPGEFDRESASLRFSGAQSGLSFLDAQPRIAAHRNQA